MPAPREESKAEIQVQLSREQLTVLQYTARGLNTDEIATTLALEPDRVRQALLTSMRQLGAHSKLEAILRAVQLGLLELGP
jgi:LuxR family transcriptional regulator, regulator of acetate metabolism